MRTPGAARFLVHCTAVRKPESMFPRLWIPLAITLGLLTAASARGAVVQGMVTSATGARLQGKIVAAYDTGGVLRGTAQTDAAGTYVLTLPNGGYRLLAYDPAGELATAFYGGAESFETTPVVQAADGAPLQASFTLARGGRITGSVAGGSTALAGAVVEAYNLSGTRRGFTVTNAAGEYSLVLPAGDYKVFAYDAAGVYAGEFHQNVRAFADASPLHVTPPEAMTVPFALERAARASGRVLDADTHAGLASMLVYAYTAEGSFAAMTTTDASGAFHFSLGPGQYRFVAADPARTYGPAFYAGGRSFAGADVVTLSAGQPRPDLNLHAERGAQIAGHVPPQLTVVAYNPDGTVHATAQAGANGAYVLVVAPGEYKLAAIDPSGGYAAQFFPRTADFLAAYVLALLGGQTLTGIDFDPPRAGRFTGTVRNFATGQALEGKTIVAYDASGTPVAQATSAADGTYTLAVAPGQYRLLAFDDTLQFATAYAGGAASYDTTVPLSVAADATVTADLAMRRGTRVNGTVLDADGLSLSGIDVFALDLAGNRVAAATTTAGAFSMVLLPGTYRFLAVDPAHRYFSKQYAGGATVTVGSFTPGPIAFLLDPVKRRRLVRH